MPLSQYGALNTTALVVPDLYVQIVPPQSLTLNGVPSNIIGMVGTASWGPVNQPVVIGSAADYAANFGPVMARKFDAGTHVAVALQQGANAFSCVRVSDGTDTVAQALITITATLCLTLTARWTGSLGASISYTLTAGSKTATTRLTIYPFVGLPEVFDNIPGTAGTLWTNIAAAVNAGNSTLRGPSQFVTAAAAAGVAAPVLSSTRTSLTGGADGVSTVTGATLVGTDALHSGMYALAGQNIALLDLVDLDDTTQWSTVSAFALGLPAYAILAGPSGDTISNAATIKGAAGLDIYSAKILLGDYLYWNDQTNGVVRLVSPAAFAVGQLANLSPQNSGLNKPIYSIAGSQKAGLVSSGTTTTYSTAELQALALAGIDVITNPAPGGRYWAPRFGHNSSSRADIHGDNYTRMTNYIASTLNAGMGIYIGRIISPALFNDVTATLNTFLAALLQQNLLVPQNDGSNPYQVVCSAKNNPPGRTGLGYLQADVMVRYGAVVEYFIVNLQGGQTVTVTNQSQLAAQS